MGRSRKGDTVSLQPYHDFAVFRDSNWEKGTHQLLRPPVSDLRENLLDDADSLFGKFEQPAFERIHQPRARGREATKLDIYIDSLQTALAETAVKCADEFRKVAAANANLIDGDPLDWAYAQVHNVLCEFLNIPVSSNAAPHAESLPKGHRLRILLKRVCDGKRNITSEASVKAMESAAAHSEEWEKVPF